MTQVANDRDDQGAADGDVEPALVVTGLSKSFGDVAVLEDITLRVRPGTVHALLGGNGSGKSTTIKILAGVHSADSGHLEVQGVGFDLSAYGPADAERAGLRFVHQDLGLFDDLSVQENFALSSGYPVTPARRVDWKRLRTRVQALLRLYGISASPDTPINRLRPSDRTLVAIARALQDDETGRLVVVLDEPTASLGREESSELLARIKTRANQGQTFIIVSHRLQEVLAVSDDYTVLRDGRVAGHLVGASPTEDELIALMAGRQVASLRPTGSIAHARSAPLLTLRGIESGPLRGVDLTLHKGELLGIAGLAGSGRSTLLSCVFGSQRPSRGEMRLGDHPHAPRSVSAAMSKGIALVPEDRGREAAFADLSIAENLWITVMHRVRRRGFLPRGPARRYAAGLIERFQIKVSGPGALFSSMSGGNQQKTVIARWLQRDPRVLLLDEPTQGVDVMSRAEIYALIRESTASENGVIIASSDLAELHALCDRIIILAQGRIIGDVAASEVSLDDLAALILTTPIDDERASA